MSHPYLSDYGPAQKNVLAVQQPPTFSTQVEKMTLDRMKAAGVDIDVVMENVTAQRCDSLAGWWTLLVEKEMRKEKRRQRRRSESRRISTASMIAAAELLRPPIEGQETEWHKLSLSSSKGLSLLYRPCIESLLMSFQVDACQKHRGINLLPLPYPHH